ncbi:MAG: DoxX family protein [Bacteroidota bacterium]|jgi:uncharacterized membrane protein|nr:DoxX family protein [Bacteroidota bacterium]
MDIGKILMGVVYIMAGLMHFVKPKLYMKIMPPYLPLHRILVYLSGLFEALFGALLLIPSTQNIGAWGLIATLLAVFPANLYMLTSYKGKKRWYKVALWLRLPLQFVLIYWAWLYT